MTPAKKHLPMSTVHMSPENGALDESLAPVGQGDVTNRKDADAVSVTSTTLAEDEDVVVAQAAPPVASTPRPSSSSASTVVTPVPRSHSNVVVSPGMSELSNQLTALRATNKAQSHEMARLQRRLKILADLEGISVADLQGALQQACEAEAHGELKHHVASLRAQLEAAMSVSENKDALEQQVRLQQTHNEQLAVIKQEMAALQEKLQEQLQSGQARESDLEKEKESLRARIEQLEGELRKLQEENEVLRQNADEAAAQRSRAALDEIELAAAAKLQQEAEDNLTSEREKSDLLKQGNSELRNRVAVFEKQLHERQSELEKLESSNQAILLAEQEKNSYLQNEIDRLGNENEELQKELEAAKAASTKLAQEGDSNRQQDHDKIATLQKEIEKLQQLSEKLKAELEDARTNLKRVEEEGDKSLREERARVRELKAELATHQGQIQELSTLNEELKVELDEATKGLKHLEGVGESALQEERERMEALRAKMTTVQNRIEELQEANEKLKDELQQERATLKRQQEANENALQEERKKLQVLHARVDELERQNKVLITEKEKALATGAAATASAAVAQDAMIKEQAKKIKTLQAGDDQTGAKIAAIEAANQRLRREIQKKTKDLASAGASSRQVDAQAVAMAKQSQQIDTLGKELAASKAEIGRLQVELTRVKKARDDLLGRLRQIEANFKAKTMLLDEQLGELDQQRSSLYAAFGIIREEQDEKDQDQANLKVNLNEADAEVARRLLLPATSPSLPRQIEAPRVAAPATTGGIEASSAMGHISLNSSKPVLAGVLLLKTADFGDGEGYVIQFGISQLNVYAKKPFAMTLHIDPEDVNSLPLHLAAPSATDYDHWFAALKGATSGVEDDDVDDAPDLANATHLS